MGVSHALFQKLEKLESPGEKTGDFSFLDQSINNFLKKETCKLEVVGKQLVTFYKLLIQHLTHSYKSGFHQSKKTLISARTFHLVKAPS